MEDDAFDKIALNTLSETGGLATSGFARFERRKR
jgi:hypothetical protein